MFIRLFPDGLVDSVYGIVRAGSDRLIATGFSGPKPFGSESSSIRSSGNQPGYSFSRTSEGGSPDRLVPPPLAAVRHPSSPRPTWPRRIAAYVRAGSFPRAFELSHSKQVATMTARNKIRLQAGMGLLLTATAGCTSLDSREESESALVGPTWQLTAIEEAGSVATLPPEALGQYTITFGVKGQAHFRLACNTGNASWTAQFLEGRIQINPIASTRKLCPDMTVSNRIARELPGDRRYRFSTDERTMLIQSDTITFRFTR